MNKPKIEPYAHTLINVKTHLIWVYMDLAEKHLMDIIFMTKQNDSFKHEVKKKLNAMQKLTENFRTQLNGAMDTDMRELFGDESDKLEAIINREIFEPLKQDYLNQQNN